MKDNLSGWKCLSMFDFCNNNETTLITLKAKLRSVLVGRIPNQPIKTVFYLFRVLIGSPLSGQPAKRTGDVYKCPVGKGDNTCVKLELPSKNTECVCKSVYIQSRNNGVINV